jgi:hypothetical protein
MRNKALMGYHNSQNGNTFTVGTNKFADWTSSEYKRLLGFRRQPSANANYVHLETDNLPDSIDWRTKGAVTGVKDQG